MGNGIMIEDFQTLLREGKDKADREWRSVLVSFAARIEPTDPLRFFADAGAKFAGSRFFWSDAEGGAVFVGLGTAVRYEPPEAADRFRRVEDYWRQMMDGAVVSADAPDLAGPVFFGGFSFDPDKPRSDLWRLYPHTLFIVPEYMLTAAEGTCWLTVNRLVPPGAAIDAEVPDWLSPGSNRRFAAAAAPVNIIKEEMDPAGWMRTVEEAAHTVRSGELDKVVLARELRLYAERPFSVEDVLAKLYAENAHTYVFALEQGEHCLIGASPERIARGEGRRLLSTCLAGSIARGRTPAEDEALGKTLIRDVKNRHEHQLTVRMIEDTMRRHCDRVEMPEGMILYKLKDIQHLYTPVFGQAKEGVSLLRLVEDLHPTPALGGMPQGDAVRWIRRREPLDRGWYAAPIGWLNRRLDGEFAAAIRSALLRGKEASLFAGCGIVGDSEPRSEYEETALKFRPMLSALGASEAGEVGAL